MVWDALRTLVISYMRCLWNLYREQIKIDYQRMRDFAKWMNEG
jgi:hypothetical protein